MAGRCAGRGRWMGRLRQTGLEEPAAQFGAVDGATGGTATALAAKVAQASRLHFRIGEQ